MQLRANSDLPWPTTHPASGNIMLRQWREDDVDAIVDLSTCAYTPHVTTLPAQCTHADALAYVRRQQGRHAEGRGFSFCIADALSDVAVGGCGLWLAPDALVTGRATVGYTVCPAARGRGIAAQALATLVGFAWTIPELHRVEAYIEPWNEGSWRSAELAGLVREGLLRSHQIIGGQRVDMLLYAATRDRNQPT